MVEDKLLANIAIEHSFITAKELNECMHIQDEIKKMGLESRTLASIMLEKGYITDENMKEIETIAGGGKRSVRVAGYEIISKIGKGAMGNVYKARQVSMDRIVALKVLGSQYAKDEKFIQRFLREARASAKLHHQNIVIGLDVGESEGYYYYAMEFVDGSTLSKILKEKGPFSERDVLDIGAQVGHALEHAHENKFVHRDVKPENIMFTEDKRAKLCDLGLAKQTSADVSLTLAGQTLGTPHYLSPEQARGARDVDIRSDIYALGCTMYHIAAGRVPFEGKSPMAIISQHVSKPVEPPSNVKPGLSKNFDRLILKMMEKDAAKRYQTPKELVEDIENLIEGRPLGHKPKAVPVAKPVGGGVAAELRMQREARAMAEQSSGKGWIIFIAIAAVALIGVVVFLNLPGKPDQKTGKGNRDVADNTGGAGPVRPDIKTEKRIGTEEESKLNSLFEELKNSGDSYAGASAKIREFMRSTANGDLKQKALSMLDGTAIKQQPKVIENADKLESEGNLAGAAAALREFAEAFEGTAPGNEAKTKANALAGKIAARFRADKDRATALANEGKFAEARAVFADVEKYGTDAEKSAVKAELENIAAIEREAADKAAFEKAKFLDDFLSRVAGMINEYKFAEAVAELAKIKDTPVDEEKKKRIEELSTVLPTLAGVYDEAKKGAAKQIGKNFSVTRREMSGVTGTVQEVTADAIKMLRDAKVEEVKFSTISPQSIAELASKSMPDSAETQLALGIFIISTGGKDTEALKYLRRAKDRGAVMGEYGALLDETDYRAGIEKAGAAEKRGEYLDAAILYARTLSAHGKKPFVDRDALKEKVESALKKSGVAEVFHGTVGLADNAFVITYLFDCSDEVQDFPDYPWNKENPAQNMWSVEDSALIGEGDDGVIWKGQVEGNMTVEAIVRGMRPDYAQFRFRFYNSGKGFKSTDYIFAFNASDYRSKQAPMHALGVYKDKKYNWLKEGMRSNLIASNKATRVRMDATDESLRMSVEGTVIASIAEKKYRKGQLSLQIYKSKVAFEEIKITAQLDMDWLKKELKKVKK